jgi:hypothetical protein
MKFSGVIVVVVVGGGGDDDDVIDGEEVEGTGRGIVVSVASKVELGCIRKVSWTREQLFLLLISTCVV